MQFNKSIAIIGDIHGCYNTLVSLFQKIKGVDEFYSVGDLIDRGKYSKEVVQFCIDNQIRSVRGNHEDMLLKAIDSTDKFFGFMLSDAKNYYNNGGRETQYSYINSRVYSDLKLFTHEIKSLGHYQWIKNFPLKYEFEKVIISHAGIIEGGNDVTIIWNRKTPAFIDKLQVFGHTPLQDYIHRKNYYTNIDTGCVYQNKLTAIVVDTAKGTIEDTIEEYCNELDVNENSETL